MTRRDSWLVNQLPMGMLDDDFFLRFATMFEAEATSLLAGVDNIPNVVDPTVAPPEMVRWLGSWIGGARLDSSREDAFGRRLVRAASDSLAWRGTRAGLESFLEGLTGQPAQVAETGSVRRESDAGSPQPFVRMTVAGTAGLDPVEFAGLVADEVPANTPYEIWLSDRRIWPAPDPAGEPKEIDAR